MNDSNNKVGIDSGMLLLVDPSSVGAEVLKKVLYPNDYGVTSGVILHVPGGDCVIDIVPSDSGPLIIENGIEPCWCEGSDPDCEICEEFGPEGEPWELVSRSTIMEMAEEWSD